MSHLGFYIKFPTSRPIDEESPTINYVLEFAADMEHKLAKNRHKGDREGWINDTPGSLLERLKEEVKELELAIEVAHMGGIISEAADVGNFAMMIADIARQLQSVKGPGEFARPEATNPALVVEPKSELPGNVKFEAGEPPIWVPVEEMHPNDDQVVLAQYVGVYAPRVVTFWRDGGGHPHFGHPIQPATHWLPIPEIDSTNWRKVPEV